MIHLIRRAVLVFSMAVFALRADPPRPVVEPVADLFTAAPFDQQRLGGVLASRMRANTEGYLEHVPFQKIEQALDGTEDLESRNLGRSAGLLLESAANSYEYSDDERLKKVMDKLAKLLISHQQTGGYIGAYPQAQRWSHGDISSQSAILLALTAYYRVTGNDEALIASRRIANSLIDHLSRGKGAVADPREVVLPLLELFRATNDNRYLAFCRKLSQSSLSELGTENGAYGFLSLLSGLVNLYQLTGDEAYAKDAISGWKRVRKEQLTVTGAPVSKGPSEAGCLTQAWLRLNLDLFRVEGDPGYAQEIERTVYNQLLASQDSDTGRIDADIPVAGSKATTMNIQPCAAAVSLGISEIPQVIWGRLGAGIAVLSYQPGRVNLRTRRRTALELYTESEYPGAGSVLLHVEPNRDAKFPLQLLVPSWTKLFKAEIGSTVLLGKPGQFLTIEREWKKGDTIKVSIDMTVAGISDTEHRGEIAVQRGPQILCLVKGHSSTSDFSAVTVSPTSLSMKAVDNDAGTYALLGKNAGRAEELTFVPLADTDMPYRLWIKASD